MSDFEPAFPVEDPGGGQYSGMTLRDYFASQALSSIQNEESPKSQAEYAYRIADAMLEERENEN